ncbi:MAG: hypothetical protein L6R38_000779, partial [Xanthoria sp. 2 TBL-2021]
MRHKAIKFWIDYCDGGDLVTLVEYHLLKQIPIPEGFLRHTLISLTSALAFLYTGVDRSDPDRPPLENWQPVIHRDIKPDHIFLKLLPASNPSTFTSHENSNKAIYPTLVLGDFGLATTYLTACKKSKDYFIGIPAYQPPQLPVYSLYSDIWAAGAIVHYLAISLPPIKDQPYFDSRSIGEFECDPSVRQVQDVTTCLDNGKMRGGEKREKGYSKVMKEYL